MQDAVSGLPWSCAKQLSVQLGTPTPQAYPAGIAPTPRTASKQPAAMHPAGSWLFPPPNSKPLTVAATSFSTSTEVTGQALYSSQFQKHQRAAQSSSAAHATPHEADADILSACKQLEESAAMLAPHNPRQRLAWQAQAGAKALLQGSLSKLPQSDVELTSACQQLAEAAAGHAQHSASLQQTFTELSRQHSPSRDSAESSVAAARPKITQLKQSSCSSACAALLQAAEASCTEDVQGVEAEHAHHFDGSDPQDLTLACGQLTEAVSAHACQQQQLQQLLQQQLAAAPSKGLSPAVAAHQVAVQPSRPHEAAKLAFDRAVGCSKLGARAKQRCSAVYTAAWPPGPPDQQLKGLFMQASVAGRAAKGLSSRAGHFHSSVCTDVYPQMCRSANLGHYSDKAPVEAKLASMHEVADVAEVQQLGSPPLLLLDTLVHEQDIIRPQLHGLTTVAVSDKAVETDVMKHLQGNAPATSDLEIAASGAYLEAVVDEAEPSFGAVHAMLSALQLPKMEAAMPWEDNALAHKCNLLQEGAISLENSPEYTSCRSFLTSAQAALPCVMLRKPLGTYHVGPHETC